jgi:peptide/nickel transport system permease protein
MPRKVKLWRVFKNNRLAIGGGVIAFAIILVGLLGPFIAPYDPLEQDILHRLTAPDREHLFGTDEYGRDVLSRMILGTRVSLAVGCLSVALGLVVGTVLGMAAGYAPGTWLDTAIMRLIDILLSFPALLTGIMVAAMLGSGLDKLVITIGIVLAPRFARLAYGPTLIVQNTDYVNAARTLGAGTARILARHILPNIFDELLVAATLWIGTAILTEASLSFLGLGVSPPTPTWGNMIKAGMDRLTSAPWLATSPGMAILVTVLAFNMLGDGLRDIADPKLRT